MGLRWAKVLAPLWGAGALQAHAQTQAREFGVQAIGTVSDPGLAVAGVYGAVRPSPRARLAIAAAVGTSDRETAWRGELLGHFLLSPEKRRGPGFYAGGGIAGVTGPVERGYFVLMLGVEERPGAASGWAVEAGVGGGARLALGYRWRWP